MTTQAKQKKILKEADLAEAGIDEIKINEEFQDLLYPLSDSEKAGLRAGIQDEGLRVAIDIDESGTILDGHHRYDICQELKVAAKFRLHQGQSNEKKLELIYSRNMDRRQISPDQHQEALLKRAKNLLKLREKDPGKYTNEVIGRKLNKDESWVRKFANRTNPNWKRADARVKVPKKEWPVIKQRKQAGESLSALAANFGVVKSTIKKIVDKETAKEQRLARLAEAAETFQDPGIDFRYGDFSEVLDDIGDGAIDAIITDPPYEKDSLADWAKLGELAARVLSPNGWLAAYVGHYHLLEITDGLRKSLDYYWFGMVKLDGFRGSNLRREVNVGNRPFVIFRPKGASPPKGKRIDDTLTGGKREKEFHPWQQPLSEFRRLVEMFTDEGQVVLDPFAGTGTTLIAARQAGRIAIGAEIDKETYEIASGRIATECAGLLPAAELDVAAEANG
jgi:16S rRNA G966 N2-methylase RsmD